MHIYKLPKSKTVISAASGEYFGKPLKEVDIALRWQKKSKSLSGKLFTTDGSKVVVIEPGTLNRDSGPDFKNAMILIDGKVLKGDIEIHIHSRSWYEHDHQINPSYGDVILHVVAFELNKNITLNCNGSIIPTLKFPLSQDWNARISKKMKWPWEEGCNHELVNMSPGEIYLLLIRLGRERLYKKRKRFNRQLGAGHSYGEILYRGVARALGYSINASQFSKFCRYLPLNKLKRIVDINRYNKLCDEELDSLLFGFSGLLETGRDDEKRKILIKRWSAQKKEFDLESMKSYEWSFFRIRPQNFPTRRMAALSEFLKRYDPDTFFYLAAYTAKRSTSPEGFIGIIESSLTIHGNDYWGKMAGFGKSMPRRYALIGKNRARSIVLNVILPLLSVFAYSMRDNKLADRVEKIQFVYPPEQDNSILKHVRKFVLPCSSDHSMFSNSSLVQQGMLQLNDRWCSSGDSYGCPLSSYSGHI